MAEIERKRYLNELIELQGNGMVKIITGMRRCGKSYLLFNIFTQYLESIGVDQNHIIKMDFDDRENIQMRRDPILFSRWVKNQIVDKKTYYILLDEIQLLEDFEGVLNGLLRLQNVEIYVTGSNAKLLSKDVITEFRGRGWEIKMHPLNFQEFMSAYDGHEREGLEEYMIYGGLPQICDLPTHERKQEFLKSIFTETYIRDIFQRYDVQRDAPDLEEIINVIASNIGTLTNPNKIANTFHSEKHSEITYPTVARYIDYMCDSFILEKSLRYDIKGRDYINSPFKYYFADLGLRNARIDFRQLDEGHIMENIVYNELRLRGYNVDVGVVPTVTRNKEGRQIRSNLEVDFVCNKGSKRYYIQSAYKMDNEEKSAAERASLLAINDSFKKIVITSFRWPAWCDEHGITTMSIYDFLLKDNSLEL